MSTICYRDTCFQPKTLAVIEQANEIIEEYQAQGFSLTLRQIYYQFVSRDLIANKQSEYKRLGSIVNDGRLAGLIDWDAIEDRTRDLMSYSQWANPADRVQSAARSYAIDLWEGQEYRVEVWVEKEALAGVVEAACDPLQVPYFSCRGYVSQSEMHGAAKRLERWANLGYTPIIFHLGDHDPSGIDMTRDIEDRLQEFSPDADIQIERLALNFDQVQRYRPPPNPAKETDSRHAAYVVRFGRSSWELDALDPTTLARLITAAVQGVRDDDLWNERIARQEGERKELTAAARRWPAVRGFLGGAP